MAYHCTILGNPRCLWLIIAQSWETPDDCTIHLLHIVIEIKVPTTLSYPPISRGWANDKNVQNLYMNIEKKFLIPQFLPLSGGILPILGGYWPILPFIMGTKWGDKSVMLLTRIISPITVWFNLIILPWVQVHSYVLVLFPWSSLPSFTQTKLITAESKF